ncbi:hypothetical protein B5P44_01400 [Mycobacterium sp. CBMA 213]|nr:hypothetical protein [Mycolicibacterium sp. CBMA 213]
MLARMAGTTWAVYAVHSSDSKHHNATYTIDEMDDGSMQVFLDYESGESDGVLLIGEGGFTDDGLLDEIDRLIREQGLPPRGDAVVAG